jgi:hypothetical protein
LTLTEKDFQEAFKKWRWWDRCIHREETTSRVMAIDRPYGEFYDFYSVSTEYFGLNPRILAELRDVGLRLGCSLLHETIPTWRVITQTGVSVDSGLWDVTLGSSVGVSQNFRNRSVFIFKGQGVFFLDRSSAYNVTLNKSQQIKSYLV